MSWVQHDSISLFVAALLQLTGCTVSSHRGPPAMCEPLAVIPYRLERGQRCVHTEWWVLSQQAHTISAAGVLSCVGSK